MNPFWANSGISMTDKITARNKVKQYRNNMSSGDNCRYSRLIADAIINMPQFKECNNLYIYKAFRNEPDTDIIISQAIKLNKTVAIPKVTGMDMNFHIISGKNSLQSLTEGYMGITEPDSTLPVLKENSGVIIVPGVAFDRKCNRSGYGKGFYDRFLAKYPDLIKIGIAFEFQIFDEIETNAFDIPMDYIITEQQIIRKEV